MGAGLKRVVADERNLYRKNAYPSNNLRAGLWPDGSRTRMLYIQAPSSPFSPHLILAFLCHMIFLCLFPEQNGVNPESDISKD